MTKTERYRGSLLGLAAGDALGTTIEFSAPGTFEPLQDIVGGGPFGLEAGQWTDDTSLALCLAESLVKKKVFDPHDQMSRYIRWWRHGHLSSTGVCFDIGGTTSSALRRFQSTKEPYAGSTHPGRAGNGSIMRLAPVPLFFANDFAEAVAMSGESSRTTHGAETCIDGCRYLGGLIAGAVSGASKEELVADYYSATSGYWRSHPLCAEIDAVAAGSFRVKDPPAIRGTGFVVESLEAALWAFYHSEDFRHGALLAVNLGDDADTTGAVYGQLAGAYYGEAGIPESWRKKLTRRDLIEGFADNISQLAAS